jgi:hypothetical protein
MDNMRHDTRYCGLCKLDDHDQRFGAQLFLWSEPVANIDEEFGLPVGCAASHFGAIDDYAWERRRKNLECAPQWPPFENAGALFVRTGPTSVLTRLKRLAQRLDELKGTDARNRPESDDDSDDFLKVVVQAAKSFAGARLADLTDTGPWFFCWYATASNFAREYADRLDLSALQSADKQKLLAAAQTCHPFDERVAKKIRQYGNAAVSVGMICRSADGSVDSGMTFSKQSVARYFESQFRKWTSYRLLTEWFIPMLQDIKPSHREFYILSLGDLMEKAKEQWPGSPEKAAAASLYRRLQKLFRPPTATRRPIKSMDQLMGKSFVKIQHRPNFHTMKAGCAHQRTETHLGIRYDNPALFERLCEEIPLWVASQLYKQRLRITGPDELLEAFQAGKMGLVWGEAHDRYVDFIRKEGMYRSEEVLRPILVELEEVQEPEHPTARADCFVQEEDLRRRVAEWLATRDGLDRFIAVRILKFRIYRGKKPHNSKMAREWESTTGQKISGQAIGDRRNKIELEIYAALMEKSVRKGAHLQK